MKGISPDKELASLSEENAVEEYISRWCMDEVRFHKAMNDCLIKHHITLSELMENSRINRNYGYNIINGRRQKPSRDKVIAMCIAAKLSLEETQEMLAIAKVGCLYYRRERDVRIAAAINNKIEDVLKVNIILESKGLEPLEV